MQASDVPLKLPIPFANGAGGAYIRTIPVASQIGITDGAASLTDGFPPLTATPVGAGGVPPSIEDMNGILEEISAWSRWQAAGGPVTYDAAFQAAIGGYPRGAMVMSTVTFGKLYLSTADNNTTNPDAGGAGWSSWFFGGSSAGSNANGYWAKRPDGNGGILIEQWGFINGPFVEGNMPVLTFPTPFIIPDSISMTTLAVNPSGAQGNDDLPQEKARSATNFTFYINWPGAPTGDHLDAFTWRAIGY